MQVNDSGGFLGIECGATHTVALFVNSVGGLLARVTAGPANLQLLNDRNLGLLFRDIAGRLPRPSSIAIGMAGARTESDFQRIRRAASAAWPEAPCYVTNDLETALAAAPRVNGIDAKVLVLSGTGSCCFGLGAKGKSVKVGGWGHILGDKGSGYEIGLRGLKAVVFYFDRDGKWPALGERLLRALQMNEPNELIPWAQQASKAEIAALALEVFAASKQRDNIASDILNAAAASLARDATACAKRLAARGRVHFVLAGSVLLKQPQFARKVAKLIVQNWPKAVITPLRRESAWGAVELARSKAAIVDLTPAAESVRVRAEASDDLRALTASPTEQRNPASINLDKLSVREAIALMLREDARIPKAIQEHSRDIQRAIGFIVNAFRRGGRLFYAGAGTSGRLGVLDASECPPTFRTSPEMVQGIVAGGQRALWEAVEGAEDDPAAGARALEFRGVTKRDVVVGIAASGRTPFVWGALDEARKRGAKTVLLTFNPHVKITLRHRPALTIAVNVGPELLTGSTRLKSGTATKLILNMFTTIAMVRIGKVLSNLMIDVKASNSKLRDRAIRIVQQLTGTEYDVARRALERNEWQIKPAWAFLKSRHGRSGGR